jgi:hypothetical protein
MYTIHNIHTSIIYMYIYIYIIRRGVLRSTKTNAYLPSHTHICMNYTHTHTHSLTYDMYLKTHSNTLQSTHIIYIYIYVYIYIYIHTHTPYIIHTHTHTHLHEGDERWYGPSSSHGLLRKILKSQCPSIISYMKQLYRVLLFFQKSCLCLFVVNG